MRRQIGFLSFGKAAAQKRKWTEDVGAFVSISRVQRLYQRSTAPCFMPVCLHYVDSARLSCRLAVRWLFSRCTRTIGLTAGGAEWLCHGCVYTCLSLHCAVHTYMQAASTVRCFDKSSPLRLARLSLLLRWLADWLDVKRNMQAVFVIGLTRSWSARDKQG